MIPSHGRCRVPALRRAQGGADAGATARQVGTRSSWRRRALTAGTLWVDEQTRLINHERLLPSDPEHRQVLYQRMAVLPEPGKRVGNGAGGAASLRAAVCAPRPASPLLQRRPLRRHRRRPRQPLPQRQPARRPARPRPLRVHQSPHCHFRRPVPARKPRSALRHRRGLPQSHRHGRHRRRLGARRPVLGRHPARRPRRLQLARPHPAAARARAASSTAA